MGESPEESFIFFVFLRGVKSRVLLLAMMD